MKTNNNKVGVIGETAVTLELLKRGFDVININTAYRNYKNADLICMNPDTGKSEMIQVKTGTTHSIMVGLVSELDGTIPNIDTHVIGPWVFVYIPKEDYSKMAFYVVTKEEITKLITTSNNWYVNEWNRKLTCKTLVAVSIEWLEGENSKAKKTNKYDYPEFKNPLGHNSINRWDKIDNLLK